MRFLLLAVLIVASLPACTTTPDCGTITTANSAEARAWANANEACQREARQRAAQAEIAEARRIAELTAMAQAMETANAPTVTPQATMTATPAPTATSAPTVAPTATPEPVPTETPEPVAMSEPVAAVAVIVWTATPQPTIESREGRGEESPPWGVLIVAVIALLIAAWILAPQIARWWRRTQ